MSQHSAVAFRRRLQELFEDRIRWLSDAINGPNPGRPVEFTRRRVSRTIERLQELASSAVVRTTAREEFEKTVQQTKTWRNSVRKGRGWREKKRHFSNWFDNEVQFPNCIYIFWAGSRCRYVGRTIRGKGRPQQHFVKTWFNGVTSITVHSTSTPSHVPKLECLAIHRFEPRENGMAASIPKWAKKCPVCETHKLIRLEVRTIFRLRR